MRNGQVTSPDAPRVAPVVYIDLDIVPFEYMTDDELRDQAARACTIEAYPSLKALLLTLRGPGGNGTIPVYRIEGPLNHIIRWLVAQYGAGTTSESVEFFADQMCLAK
jgi:hypothetical protein